MGNAIVWSFVLSLLVGTPSQSVWLGDYGVALRQAELEGRPLLIVIDGPTDGQQLQPEALSQDGATVEVLKSYKLCHVDASTPYGGAVARAFKATTLPHMAIIDNTASVQLFKKSGPLNANEWRATLAGYRSGERPTPLAARRPTICFT